MIKRPIHDYSKLKGRIKEICGTQLEFANRMDLSDRTVSLLLTNRRTWKQEYMEAAAVVLDFPVDDIPKYFCVLVEQSVVD
ncbi:MAG: DUF739 family protein [Oscillospiraceae bacterium]|nr:DUF739 family protein [Oscillospiraceae bacterium]